MAEGLAGVTRLGFDTAPIIYFVEEHPQYLSRLTLAFDSVAAGRLLGITSTLTLAEVLVQPIRRGAVELQRAYSDRLMHSEYFETRPIDSAVAQRAAELRASFNIRLPDALQLATALVAGCDALLTNDRALQKIHAIRILLLDDLD